MLKEVILEVILSIIYHKEHVSLRELDVSKILQLKDIMCFADDLLRRIPKLVYLRSRIWNIERHISKECWQP